LRVFDYLVTFIAVAFTSASAIFIYGGSNDALFVKVSAGTNGARWVHPLSATEHFSVSGPLGETFIEIKDGKARITDSPCENKTCVASGAIHGEGAFVACLPNRVILTVESRAGGGAADEIDAATW
jgi:hypothetical protein